MSFSSQSLHGRHLMLHHMALVYFSTGVYGPMIDTPSGRSCSAPCLQYTVSHGHPPTGVESGSLVPRRINGLQPIYVVDVPDRPNIKYTVIQQLYASKTSAFSSLVGAIRQERVQMGRVLALLVNVISCSGSL